MNEQVQIPDFLGGKKTKMPVGGDFQPTGFVGQFQAARLHTFYAQDTDEASAVEQGVGPDLVEFGWFYYSEYNDAKKAISDLDIRGYEGQTATSQDVWRIEAQVPTVLNLRKPEAWGKSVAGSVEMRTFKSKRYRHALQFIALPAAVAAYATLLGYENPGFDVSELLEEGQAFTDELFEQLCSMDGVFQQRREALWKALGEDDWKKYAPFEYEEGKPNKKPGKYDTQAEKLHKCLSIVEEDWTSAVWAKVILVPDPRPDALSNHGNRLTIPVLVELYRSKAEAEAVVAKEKAERDARNGNGGSGGLTVPETYAGEHEGMFKDMIAEIKASGKPLPLMQKAVESDLGLEGVELEQAVEWLK